MHCLHAAEHSIQLLGLLAGCMLNLMQEACSSHDCHAEAACWAAAMGMDRRHSHAATAEFRRSFARLHSQHENEGQRIGSWVKTLQCAPELPSMAAVDHSLMLSQQGE